MPSRFDIATNLPFAPLCDFKIFSSCQVAVPVQWKAAPESMRNQTVLLKQNKASPSTATAQSRGLLLFGSAWNGSLATSARASRALCRRQSGCPANLQILYRLIRGSWVGTARHARAGQLVPKGLDCAFLIGHLRRKKTSPLRKPAPGRFGSYFPCDINPEHYFLWALSYKTCPGTQSTGTLATNHILFVEQLYGGIRNGNRHHWFWSYRTHVCSCPRRCWLLCDHCCA